MASPGAGPGSRPPAALPSPPLQVGQRVEPITLEDSSGRPVPIPDLGTRVLVIFYTDPDRANLNEPFRDAVHAIQSPHKRGMGIVNLKDSWKPGWLIRRVVRAKQAKFRGTLILLDPAHLLRDAWGMASCDRKDVVLIIGLDRRVKYLQYGRMDAAEIERALQLVHELIAAPQPA